MTVSSGKRLSAEARNFMRRFARDWRIQRLLDDLEQTEEERDRAREGVEYEAGEAHTAQRERDAALAVSGNWETVALAQAAVIQRALAIIDEAQTGPVSLLHLRQVLGGAE